MSTKNCVSSLIYFSEHIVWARYRKLLKKLLVILASIREFGLLCMFVIATDNTQPPTYNRQPLYMDIIQATEIWALELENDGYFEKAERLRQGVSKILSKDVNKKHRNNLTIGQRNAIREIKNDTNLKVYPFDKGSGFVIMKEKHAIKRIEEQIGMSVIIDYDPTTTLLNKFQKKLAKLKKEENFDNKTYYKVYPSDAIPPDYMGL